RHRLPQRRVAGALAVGLALHERATDPAERAVVAEAVRTIAARETEALGGLGLENARVTPYTGYAHGAMGIAPVLLRYGAEFDDPAVHGLGLRILGAVLDAQEDGDRDWPRVWGEPERSYGWCHGAPGDAAGRADEQRVRARRRVPPGPGPAGRADPGPRLRQQPDVLPRRPGLRGDRRSRAGAGPRPVRRGRPDRCRRRRRQRRHRRRPRRPVSAALRRGRGAVRAALRHQIRLHQQPHGRGGRTRLVRPPPPGPGEPPLPAALRLGPRPGHDGAPTNRARILPGPAPPIHAGRTERNRHGRHRHERRHRIRQRRRARRARGRSGLAGRGLHAHHHPGHRRHHRHRRRQRRDAGRLPDQRLHQALLNPLSRCGAGAPELVLPGRPPHPPTFDDGKRVPECN
ncbi:hypothetical protein GTW37_05375, partial [Streptomyces sp. SID4931]|nr:hypothetical protein [Streptomyces sp. SID4931]